jgi:hypothetical protein
MNPKKIAAQLVATARLLIANNITKYYTFNGSGELELSYEYDANGQIMTKQDMLVTFRILDQMGNGDQLKIGQIMRQTIAQKRSEEEVHFHNSTISLTYWFKTEGHDIVKLEGVLKKLGFRNI